MLVLAALLAGLTLAPSATAASPRMALVLTRAQGLNHVEQQSLRNSLAESLVMYGAKVRPSSLTSALAASCIEEAACARDAARGLEVDAILDVRALRVGPTLRLTYRVVAGPSGDLVEELRSTGQASDPTSELAVHEALQRAVAIARDYTPPDLVDTPPPAAVAPPTDPVAPDAPVPRAPEVSTGPGLTLTSLWRSLAWSSAGLGAGLVLGGVGSGLLSALALSEQDLCQASACADQAMLDVRTRRLALSASLLIAGGAVFGATGAGLLLFVLDGE